MDHTALTPNQAALFQEFINLNGAAVDVESCELLYEVLVLSTDKQLYVQVKQSLDAFPVTQQGGITYLKLLLDQVDARSFELTQAILAFLTSFNLLNFDGEDVAVASLRFKAAVKVLPESDVPSNITTFYLQGLSKASNAEFASLCASQLGFLKSPVYGPWARSLPSKLAEVDQFAQTMLGQYQAMKVNGTWSGASHKASAFKATALVTANTKQQGGRKSFAEWWDEQTCEVRNCGGKHPTKWHHDLGRRDRSNPNQRLGSNRRDRIQGRDGNRRQKQQKQKKQKKRMKMLIFRLMQPSAWTSC
jgi:hypothetical protein